MYWIFEWASAIKPDLDLTHSQVLCKGTDFPVTCTHACYKRTIEQKCTVEKRKRKTNLMLRYDTPIHTIRQILTDRCDQELKLVL